MNTEQEFIPIKPLETAVLFVVFNRLDTTKQVFEAIQKAEPPRLYIAADGANENKQGEAEKVQAVRDYIMQNIDWECEVSTLFRDRNLGCKYAPAGAISWFFENEEQGIILEDDCLPSQSFFWYCEELLIKYKTNESVYLISGDGRGPESTQMKEDYGFCKYPIIWGWASWSRVWKKYDPEILDWPLHRDSLPKLISQNKATERFWSQVLEKMYKNEVNAWDYQFSYLLFKNKGKCIVPRLNQITNIGFGADATHTFDMNSSAANRARYNFKLPLKHEVNMASEMKINEFYDRSEFSMPDFFSRVINKIARIFIKRNIV